ncbi:TlpA family protein disulfide reductase [Endothiovibrio diazotrophicus]
MLALALLAGCGGEQRPRLQHGDPAPPFQTENLAGEKIGLPATGEVVAIRFWADWCPYCKKEMGDIEPVYRELKGRGLRVWAVNVGQDRETAKAFVDKLGVSYQTLLDADSSIARAYGVIGLPTTYFIDRQGKVASKILGEADAATFRHAVEPLL